LARYKFTNEPSRAEPLTSEFERANELRAFRPALLVEQELVETKGQENALHDLSDYQKWNHDQVKKNIN
jgi:hypothetical protein